MNHLKFIKSLAKSNQEFPPSTRCGHFPTTLSGETSCARRRTSFTLKGLQGLQPLCSDMLASQGHSLLLNYKKTKESPRVASWEFFCVIFFSPRQEMPLKVDEASKALHQRQTGWERRSTTQRKKHDSMGDFENCEAGAGPILMCEYHEGARRAQAGMKNRLCFSPISILTNGTGRAKNDERGSSGRLPYMKNSSLDNNKRARKIAAWKKSRVGKIHNFFHMLVPLRYKFRIREHRKRGFFPNCWALAARFFFPRCNSFSPRRARYDIKQYFLGFSIPVHSVRENILLAVVCFLSFFRETLRKFESNWKTKLKNSSSEFLEDIDEDEKKIYLVSRD